jgi:hypothetical protein
MIFIFPDPAGQIYKSKGCDVFIFYRQIFCNREFEGIFERGGDII